MGWLIFGGFEPRREKYWVLRRRGLTLLLAFPPAALVGLLLISAPIPETWAYSVPLQDLAAFVAYVLGVGFICAVVAWFLFELGFIRMPGTLEPDRYLETGAVVPEGDDAD